jgi:hypothetical protein
MISPCHLLFSNHATLGTAKIVANPKIPVVVDYWGMLNIDSLRSILNGWTPDRVLTN